MSPSRSGRVPGIPWTTSSFTLMQVWAGEPLPLPVGGVVPAHAAPADQRQFVRRQLVQFTGGDADDGGGLHLLQDVMPDPPGMPHQLDLAAGL